MYPQKGGKRKLRSADRKNIVGLTNEKIGLKIPRFFYIWGRFLNPIIMYQVSVFSSLSFASKSFAYLAKRILAPSRQHVLESYAVASRKPEWPRSAIRFSVRAIPDVSKRYIRNTHHCIAAEQTTCGHIRQHAYFLFIDIKVRIYQNQINTWNYEHARLNTWYDIYRRGIISYSSHWHIKFLKENRQKYVLPDSWSDWGLPYPIHCV